MSSVENIHIIESLRLLLVYHHNLLNQKSIGRTIAEVHTNPFFREEYLILIDIRNAKIEIDTDEIEALATFVYEKLGHTALQKFAVLASNAQTSKTVQFVRNYKHSSKYQVFSTLEAALNWLKIPLQRKSQIQLKLDYLKQLSSNQSPKT